MLEKLYPDEYVDSIYHIDYCLLQEKGFNSLIFDIDNTLAPFDIKVPDDKLIQHFKDLTEKGFKIALVSNNNEKRVVDFNKDLKFNANFKAGKPKKTGLLKSIDYFKQEARNIVLVGDQIFTDVFGGNRLGMYTILVKPIANRDEFTVKLKRGIEKIVINAYLRKTFHSDTKN
jgi:uncharacterized protein